MAACNRLVDATVFRFGDINPLVLSNGSLNTGESSHASLRGGREAGSKEYEKPARSTYDLPNFKWITVKMSARSMHNEPVTTYAMPKKLFLAPMKLVVDITNRFSPLNAVTGKSDKLF
jgi:hypothetical protein